MANIDPLPPAPDGLIRIEWDKIGRGECISVNGQPLQYVSSVCLEWPGGYGRLAALTIQQVRMRPQDAEPSQLVSEGYLVPKDLWDEYERWRRDQRRTAEVVPDDRGRKHGAAVGR